MAEVETCENCGRDIGKLETPRLWNERVVCKGCYESLKADSHTLPEIPTAIPAVQHVTYNVQATRPNNGIAAILSLVIPGAGQIYLGHTVLGIVWLLGTAAGYFMCLLPGIVLHLCCVVSASIAKPANHA